MRPKSISASALLNYQCPSRFYVENVERTPSPSNPAADVGTVCHSVMEEWVKGGHHTNKTNFSQMVALYTIEYWQLLSDGEWFDDGVEMLERWYNRQDWSNEIICAEEKKSFMLPVGNGEELTFNYIIDRMDLQPDGVPVVVDYKTIRENLSPEDLRAKLQARCYGVAAQMEYPNAPGVWVKFDLLRHDVVGVYFTKEENRQTYQFLHKIANTIWNDEPAEDAEGSDIWPREVINETCRYCIRRSQCQTLRSYAHEGGLVGKNLSDATPEEVTQWVDHRAKLKWASDALKNTLAELDVALEEYLMDNETMEVEGTETTLALVSRNKKSIDPALVRRHLEPDLLVEYFNPSATVVEKILKDDDRISDEKRSILKSAITRMPAGRYLKSKSNGTK